MKYVLKSMHSVVFIIGSFLVLFSAGRFVVPNVLSQSGWAIQIAVSLLLFSISILYDDGEHKNETIVSTSEEVFGQAEWRLNAGKYLNNTQLAVPWNKLYLKEFIVQNNLQFPNIKWDDLYFNLEVIRNINQVAINPNYDYQFLRTRPGSE